jgi:plasmid stabilization system protein ParE
VDFKVRYTDPSLKDLADIFEWSWEKHPGTTEKFAASLIEHIELLKTFPRLGVLVSGHSDVRRLSHSPLQVYYRLHQGRKVVEILHVWHGARRPPKL